ncbi:MAG TPA: PRC-barrel domain-containing protein [Pedobacter sp.]|jgi:hypothetical protein
MLQSIHKLIGYTLGASDGEIGKIRDFYFDDESWKVRYLVVETGGWLSNRKVLLSPAALEMPHRDAEAFPVNLSKDQIKNSPDIDTDKPVSKQQEEELHRHYSWPDNDRAGVGFMTTGMVGGVIAPGVPFEERIAIEVAKEGKDSEDLFDQNNSQNSTENLSGDKHLRSYKATIGHAVKGTNEELGEVEDFLIDDSWSIPYMVMETGSWYVGDKTITSTKNIQKIEWQNSTVLINQSIESLKKNFEFDSSQLNAADFEQNLQNLNSNH